MAKDLAKAIEQWPPDRVSTEMRSRILSVATAKWSTVDAKAAAAFIDTTRPGGMMFAMTVSQVATNWAANDPAAALAWAQVHRETQPSGMAMTGAMIGWWQRDHGAAEASAAAHLSTLEDRQIASTLASNIYNTDPQRAKDWVSHLPDAEARQQATSMLAITMGFTDPKAASDWAVTLPSDVRQVTLDSAVAQWAASDLTAAGEWIKTLNGPTRDEATSGYIPTLSSRDPATAAAWAMSIGEGTIRNKSLDRVASDWLRKDAPAATAWIQSSELSDDQKRRLLALAPKG